MNIYYKKTGITVLIVLVGITTLACPSGRIDPCVDGHTHNPKTGICSKAGCNALTFNIGDKGPGGGIIFYRRNGGFTFVRADGSGNDIAHYLEVSPVDISLALRWSTQSSPEEPFINIPNTKTAIGTGRRNTYLILALDATAPAALACRNYLNNGKSDWFLPSKDELNQLYMNRNTVGIPSNIIRYWSSSQFHNSHAWSHQFVDGRQMVFFKSNPSSVRAVRAF